jgi:hypothetical protein
MNSSPLVYRHHSLYLAETDHSFVDLSPAEDFRLGRLKQPVAFNYRQARFKAGLDNQCSFCAMLTWLYYWAVLTGDKRAAFHALLFKGRCLQLMYERLHTCHSRGEEVDIGTMYGALDLFNTAVCFLPCTLLFNKNGLITGSR